MRVSLDHGVTIVAVAVAAAAAAAAAAAVHKSAFLGLTTVRVS